MIDITKPLEAVHKETGRVVPMTFASRCTLSGARFEGGFYTTEAPCNSTSNSGWFADGTDMCSHNKWFIRNVAAKIDVTKPLQLSDGTPARLIKVTQSGRIGVKIDDVGHVLGRMTRFFNADGTRRSSHKHITLQNAPENPVTKLDLTKTLVTRGGRPVRYLMTDLPTATIIVEIDNGFGNKSIERRNLTGTELRRTRPTIGGTSFEYAGDVINKITVETAFFNVYDDGSSSSGHSSYDSAAKYSKVERTRVGILEVVKHNGETFSTKFTALKPHRRPRSGVHSVAELA